MGSEAGKSPGADLACHGGKHCRGRPVPGLYKNIHARACILFGKTLRRALPATQVSESRTTHEKILAKACMTIGKTLTYSVRSRPARRGRGEGYRSADAARTGGPWQPPGCRSIATLAILMRPGSPVCAARSRHSPLASRRLPRPLLENRIRCRMYTNGCLGPDPAL